MIRAALEIVSARKRKSADETSNINTIYPRKSKSREEAELHEADEVVVITTRAPEDAQVEQEVVEVVDTMNEAK